mmetsp:Transcript_48696/g.97153  ORF Transcript_48696/g.97153 Transcript_48696/m.97153 type:complete len:235 (-) Transcript_48696:561-1265(-)
MRSSGSKRRALVAAEARDAMRGAESRASHSCTIKGASGGVSRKLLARALSGLPSAVGHCRSCVVSWLKPWARGREESAAPSHREGYHLRDSVTSSLRPSSSHKTAFWVMGSSNAPMTAPWRSMSWVKGRPPSRSVVIQRRSPGSISLSSSPFSFSTVCSSSSAGGAQPNWYMRPASLRWHIPRSAHDLSSARRCIEQPAATGTGRRCERAKADDMPHARRAASGRPSIQRWSGE